MTLGDIARIMVSRGEVDEALKLHQQRLPIYKALDDQAGIANTLWGMARLEMNAENFQQTYENLAQAYAILVKIGRLDGICVVGGDLGRILCMDGHKEEGLEILTRSRDGFTKLGQPQMAAQIDQMIAAINKSGG